MMDVLVELPNTQFWAAIQAYNRDKDSWAVNTISGLDAFKQPTELSRAQGIRIGVFFLEKEIMDAAHEREEKQSATQEERTGDERQ